MLETKRVKGNEENQTNLICLPCEYSGGENNFVQDSELKKFKSGLGWIQDYVKNNLFKN